MTNWLSAVGRLFRQPRPVVGDFVTDRRFSYMLFDAYYDNAIYNEIAKGGQRPYINEVLGGAAAADLAGLYNPVARVVDLYGHTLGGKWGTDIRAETTNTTLKEAIEQVWQWSNLTIEAQALTQFAPLHGLCGLRIGTKFAPNTADRRVWIKPEHPRTVLDVEQDARNNLTGILLEYDLEIGLGDQKKTIVVREEQTKERIKTWRYENGHTTPFDVFDLVDNGRWSDYENELGIVSYVLVHHTTRNRPWSYNAFYRELPAIDRLNALITHINIQIHQYVRGNFVIGAAGAAPVTMDFSGRKVLYIDLSRTGSVEPFFESLVADLNLGDAIAQAKQIQETIEDARPELKATAGRFISGQSGETIAQLRQPAEDLLALARTNYQDAVRRATQIAVSWGVLYDLWDVGTGTGSREAADQAYRSGAEDFEFNARPLLPDSPLMLLQQAKGQKEIGASEETVLRTAGLDPEQEQKLKAKERAAAPPPPMLPPPAAIGANGQPEPTTTEGGTDGRTG